MEKINQKNNLITKIKKLAKFRMVTRLRNLKISKMKVLCKETQDRKYLRRVKHFKKSSKKK